MRFTLIFIVFGLILIFKFVESDAKNRQRKLTHKKFSGIQRHKRTQNFLAKPKKAFKHGRPARPASVHSKRKSEHDNLNKAKNKPKIKSGPPKFQKKFSGSTPHRKYSHKLNAKSNSVKPAIAKEAASKQHVWVKNSRRYSVSRRITKSKIDQSRMYASDVAGKKSVRKSTKGRKSLRLKSYKTKTYFYYNEKSRQCENRTGSTKSPKEFDTKGECENKYTMEINSIVPFNSIPQSDDPAKPDVDEIFISKWVKTKGGCIKKRMPKSKMIGQIYYTEEKCMDTLPDEIVYVYNSEEHACKEKAVKKVQMIHYRSFQECYDKNIAFYYKNKKKACEKWKLENGVLKKFYNLTDCFDHHLITNTKRKNSNYYCYENNDCTLSNVWKRNCYDSRMACIKYKGRLFYVFDDAKNKCIRTLDPTGYTSTDDCIYANQGKLSKRKGKPHYFDELRFTCMPVEEVKLIRGKQYGSFEECIRSSPSVRQVSPEPNNTMPELILNCENDPDTRFFRCRNNRCIRAEYKCDRRNDCGDNSDEEKCISATTTQPCSEFQFPCVSNEECINMEKLCNGTPDCEDESDELYC